MILVFQDLATAAGLLLVLLAFSFSAAGARFLERQDRIVEEANAIGTAYLRADLLDPPHASELRTALRRYTEHRLEVSRDMRTRLTAAALEEVERLPDLERRDGGRQRVIAVAVMRYGGGIGGERRAPLTTALAILISAALWVTIDLDQ
jgi:hypothetical protein